jgi:hypothetical protein
MAAAAALSAGVYQQNVLYISHYLQAVQQYSRVHGHSAARGPAVAWRCTAAAYAPLG